MEKSEILKLVGKRIKEVRESKGISQVELVGKMHGVIDPTNISRIESGRTHTKKASHFCEAYTSVGPEGFEPPTLWV